MAKIQTLFPISGTLGDVTFYHMDGKTYARMKTSLDKKRFYTDKAYAGLPMMRVKNFGKASNLVSSFYHYLPKEVKSRQLFNHMTALAHTLLWLAFDPEDVKEAVLAHYELTEVLASQLDAIYGKAPVAPVQPVVLEAPPLALVSISEEAYPPLPLLKALQRHSTGLSTWWVSRQGALYRPLSARHTYALIREVLQPLRLGWLRNACKRE